MSAPASRSAAGGALGQARSVAARELAVEAAGRDATVTVLPLVLAALLLAGLGMGASPEVRVIIAPGLVWLVVLFAAVPLARAVAAAERAEGTWDLLRGTLRPGALFTGKLAAVWLWLALTWLGAALLAAAGFDAPLRAGGVAGGLLGTAGVAAATVVFGVALAEPGRRSGLLAVLLLPAALPALLAGAQTGTAEVAPLPWLALLVAYDAVAIAVAWAVFPVLLEE